MNFNRLEYIKNVNANDNWAYCAYPKKSYFQLNFKKRAGVESHVLNLPKGALIILSQTPPVETQKQTGNNKRYLTHVVELVNDGDEDKPQWDESDWGIFRWVKVSWVVADFQDPSSMPLDKEVMRAEWGWYDTKAKTLEGDNLMSTWGNINNLRDHLKLIFC
jgi:hypothetical protein